MGEGIFFMPGWVGLAWDDFRAGADILVAGRTIISGMDVDNAADGVIGQINKEEIEPFRIRTVFFKEQFSPILLRTGFVKSRAPAGHKKMSAVYPQNNRHWPSMQKGQYHGQGRPHRPQLSRSFSVLTQRLPHRISPVGQETLTHRPPEHTEYWSQTLP